MTRLGFTTLVLVLGGVGGTLAQAESLSGVCPDGSFFIVQTMESVPCARAKLVDPADLPPIRPQLLPRPYTWYVDQGARDPNNPYNLLEAAEKIREARAPRPAAAPGTATRATRVPQAAAPPAPAVSALRFDEGELRDLVRLVQMRQQVASAQLTLEDLRGGERLRILLAHSSAFESILLASLGLDPEERRVIAFVVSAPGEQAEFHPNFFVVQGSRTFRPDPEDPHELGLLVGSAGAIPARGLALGYLIVPTAFDPAASMELWWNDRSVAATLAPVAATLPPDSASSS